MRLPENVADWSADLREDFLERAAIIAESCHLLNAEAERLAEAIIREREAKS